ncbi:hypothetical protein P5673_007201 [Acropora cervicornis]|uniref:Uncharacterized protein n=1 Tax=Acropora cervicornis TaxID=6130 RepID=A0AAD9QVB3_ACRCE|nr:hypothetical protein P5673_007201 [Acropora cervicornis]
MIYTNNKITLLWKPLQKQDVYMFSHDEPKKAFLLNEELIFFNCYIIFIFVWSILQHKSLHLSSCDLDVSVRERTVRRFKTCDH